MINVQLQLVYVTAPERILVRTAMLTPGGGFVDRMVLHHSEGNDIGPSLVRTCTLDSHWSFCE